MMHTHHGFIQQQLQLFQGTFTFRRNLLAPSPDKKQFLYFTEICSCFNYNLRSGVMSLAENLLQVSRSFDCRVKLKTIIPLMCRNQSANTKKVVCFISNNTTLFKLVLQLQSIGVHHALPLSLAGRKPAAENTCWINALLNIWAMHWYMDKKVQKITVFLEFKR